MLWLTPLWLIAMIPVFDTWGSRRWFQLLSTGFLGRVDRVRQPAGE